MFQPTLSSKIDQATRLFLCFQNWVSTSSIFTMVYDIKNIAVFPIIKSLCGYLSVCQCVIVSKKMTRQEDKKHFFNFVWPKNAIN